MAIYIAEVNSSSEEYFQFANEKKVVEEVKSKEKVCSYLETF